jgi:hypothetical protein
LEPDSIDDQPGLANFLKDRLMCVDLTEEEEVFLKKLRFRDKKPNAFFYYRVLQALRDPLHFHTEKG